MGPPAPRFPHVNDRNDAAGAREVVAGHARLFDTSHQAVIGTTAGGIIVYWNRTAERLYGWMSEEVLGRDVVEVTPALLSQETASEIMTQLQAGRSWSGEFRVRARDEREFTVRVRDLPVRDQAGRLVGVVGISTPTPQSTAD